MAVALVGSFEELRQDAYSDPVPQGKPRTICYGNTNGVKPGSCGAAEFFKVRTHLGVNPQPVVWLAATDEAG